MLQRIAAIVIAAMLPQHGVARLRTVRIRAGQPVADSFASGAARSLTCFALALSCCSCYSATGPAGEDTADQERFWTAEPESVRIAALRGEIRRTCPLADAGEVDEAAAATIRFGEGLREAYALSRPPEHNNVAILFGLSRQRGLCYHLADELYAHLRAMGLSTLQLRRVVSSQGHPLHEHNVVVMTDVGQPIATGLVLDPWRYAGKVRFIPVAEDHGHEWKLKPTKGEPLTVPGRASDEAVTGDAARGAN